MFARLFVAFVAFFALMAAAAPTIVGRADLTVPPACGAVVCTYGLSTDQSIDQHTRP